ncbi:hypothetical protein ACQCR9_22425, partial [Ralstonia pseudosolanacearum]|uniref:hypothetical protein n=1 Tax=Ralstonia pseudosolanacearum TaxID=1310165 RepID=UPI003CE71614
MRLASAVPCRRIIGQRAIWTRAPADCQFASIVSSSHAAALEVFDDGQQHLDLLGRQRRRR